MNIMYRLSVTLYIAALVGLGLAGCSVTVLSPLAPLKQYGVMQTEIASNTCSTHARIYVDQPSVQSPYDGVRVYSESEDGVLESIPNSRWVSSFQSLLSDELRLAYARYNELTSQLVILPQDSALSADVTFRISGVKAYFMERPEEQEAVALAIISSLSETTNSVRQLRFSAPLSAGASEEERMQKLRGSLSELQAAIVASIDAWRCGSFSTSTNEFMNDTATAETHTTEELPAPTPETAP